MGEQIVRKKFLPAFCCFIFIITASCARRVGNVALPDTTQIEKTGWNLYWHDEFNGSYLNAADWNVEDIKWPYSSELEFYTPRPDNLKIENGNLVIIARSESYSGANYTSARINTKVKVQSAYGYIEARIKLPYGKGIWPAFWMLMEPSVYPTYYGEIDIAEMIGGGEGKDNVNFGTAHWGDVTIISNGTSTSVPWPEKLTDNYHIYAVEWNTSIIKWYFDGVIYHTVDITSAEQDELHQPQYLIFNIAVGGDWPGNPDGTTVWPQYMYVDWVRWWKK